MSRICPDCEGLKNQTRSFDEPHEYLVPTGRAKGNGTIFYKCLLCNTFLTCVPEDGAPRWNAGFRPYGVPAQTSASA